MNWTMMEMANDKRQMANDQVKWCFGFCFDLFWVIRYVLCLADVPCIIVMLDVL